MKERNMDNPNQMDSPKRPKKTKLTDYIRSYSKFTLLGQRRVEQLGIISVPHRHEAGIPSSKI